MTKAPPTKPLLVTKKFVAEQLSVSIRTVDRLCAAGELKKVFVGGSVRFRWEDIVRLIEAGAN